MKFYRNISTIWDEYVFVTKIEDDVVYYKGITVVLGEGFPLKSFLVESAFNNQFEECEFNPVLLYVMTPFDVARYRKGL